jgi:uncharacterized protein YciI
MMKSGLTAMLLATLLAAPMAQAQAPAKPKQYVYILKVAPHLHDEAKWTDKDKAATGAHFKRLQQATASGQVILAGKSSEALDKTFGLVIFEAADEAAAKAFMDSDPAVMAGTMSATLHPYAVALQRK